MSSASYYSNGVPVGRGSDWWELTNFGTNEVDLTGYYWIDNTDRDRQYACFQGVVIQPGESVVFFRSQETPNEAEFRRWWAGCLGANVRVISYPKLGFNDEPPGDEVQVFDAEGNLVDGVSFPEARIGTTFVSDPVTGEFGLYSTLDECGACKGQAHEAQDRRRSSCGWPGCKHDRRRAASRTRAE